MRKYMIYEIISVMRNKNYILFEDGSLNLIAVRNLSKISNTFNDVLYNLRLIDNHWNISEYIVTTDPGSTTLIKPINMKGTAIIKPGQYKGLWAVGKHKGLYPALVQVGNCTVLRDNNKDDILNFDTKLEETGNYFGINCHKAANIIISKFVNSYSAGCVVHADARKFDNEFMIEMKKDAEKYGNSFTFTLLEEQDFK